MIIVLLAFCLISISCQSTPEEDPVIEEIKIDVIIVTLENTQFEAESIELLESEIDKLQEMVEDGEASNISITFGNIQFEVESTVLLENEIFKLQQIAEILLGFPENDLLVSGHVLHAGSEEGRKKLSEDRANVVANHLIEMGIKTREQISIRGVGSSEPIAPSDTPQNKALNRRVEITVLEK